MDADFKLRKIWRGIYLVTFPTQYDTSMHFLRPQEFYECADPKIRGQNFSLIEYMRWYCVDRHGADGVFSYADDWSGFNVPDWVFEKLYVEGSPPDENGYDRTMRAVYETVRRQEDEKFYIVGTKESGSALDHELAHGLYYIEEDYREEQHRNFDKLVKKRGEGLLTEVHTSLSQDGYMDGVLVDEAQAYLATGISDSMYAVFYDNDIDGRKLTWLRKPFVNTFERWAQRADMPWRSVS